MNSQEIDKHLKEELTQRFATERNNLLCKCCGYPKCECKKCGGAKGSHSCWLRTRGVGKRSKKFMAETPDQSNARMQAWAAFGLNVPTFCNGYYQFE